MARKQTEQRRIERLRAATQREFARKAEDRVAAQKQLDQQRREAARRDAQKRYDARHDQSREKAVLQAKEREKRHLADQQAEHRHQTDRLRKRHVMETRSHKDNENAGIALHARKVQNIDLAEARELKELAAHNRSLKGRITKIWSAGPQGDVLGSGRWHGGLLLSLSQMRRQTGALRRA
ncbi:hypothetical protein SAZ10_29375 [Mesorhizobium sp. BAC0120]|uniref:hypothetical protein n=1 Tax=Mesorhizobium sp. BAC0120 TaxID=3090670 RepID=UPI00298D04E3|nr:hypothetical protein [Mesorhizobium sp. BAC0120]MDW6025879.1 hypothetical protein [Mesorhizobium sp. BAC0120]